MSEAKRLLTQINERVTDVVYHSTYPKSLSGIMDSDAFRLTAVPANDREEIQHQKGKKFYFLSLSRTPRIPNFRFLPVVLVLDGRKLSQRYSGGPINYFTKSKKDVDYFEYEDRVFSNEPWIEKAHEYISEIHVKAGTVMDDGGRSSPKYIIHAWYLAKQHGIPFYVYDDQSYSYSGDYWKLSKQNTMTPKEFEEKYIHIKPKEYKYDTASKNDDKTMKSWIELLSTPSQYRTRLSGDAETYLMAILDGRFKFGGQIDDMIGKYRKSEATHKLVDAMRRAGVRSGSGVFSYLKKKWGTEVGNKLGQQ